MSNSIATPMMPPVNATVWYLADDAGATSGPFTETELASLREEGKLESFRWMWDGRSPDWKPLHRPAAPAMPMPPVGKAAATPAVPAMPAMPEAPRAAAAPAAVGRAPEPTVAAGALEAIRATCFDHHCLLSGSISRATSEGCEILLADEGHPTFAPQGTIQLNLLDGRDGRSVTFPVRLARLFRKDGHWALKVTWKDCPELLL